MVAILSQGEVKVTLTHGCREASDEVSVWASARRYHWPTRACSDSCSGFHSDSGSHYRPRDCRRRRNPSLLPLVSLNAV